jgi:hypothetical protein
MGSAFDEVEAEAVSISGLSEVTTRRLRKLKKMVFMCPEMRLFDEAGYPCAGYVCATAEKFCGRVQGTSVP